MAAVAFDTLKFARTLREKAKLSSEQADGLAEAIAEAVTSDLAAKADIGTVRTELRETELRLKADIGEVELRLKAEIERAKAETIKWVMGTIGFQTLAIIGAIVALARLGLR